MTQVKYLGTNNLRVSYMGWIVTLKPGVGAIYNDVLSNYLLTKGLVVEDSSSTTPIFHEDFNENGYATPALPIGGEPSWIPSNTNVIIL